MFVLRSNQACEFRRNTSELCEKKKIAKFFLFRRLKINSEIALKNLESCAENKLVSIYSMY